MQKVLRLQELNTLVGEVIETTLTQSYWVQAELMDVRENRGHCYMELLEKDEFSGNIVARARANCWKGTWMLLRPQFERVTHQQLRAGMKVLLQVHAQFHAVYGFSWIVDDLDPTYTLGDMARRRMEIIRKLKDEGIFDLQKDLELPLFAQRIAVISSATAAGYGDFCNQLKDNAMGLKFYPILFQATMQGEQTEQSVIAALNRIAELEDKFDVVVIIRGGGATADLVSFDTLALGENVAQFPLPIITGIGHDRDESILDMVSFLHVKTPTAAAAFLVDHLTSIYNKVEDCQGRILQSVGQRMDHERQRLSQTAQRIPILFSLVRQRQASKLERLLTAMKTAATRRTEHELNLLLSLDQRLAPSTLALLTRQHHRVEMLGQRVKALDPQLILRRGYSITLHNGRAVKDAAQLKAGDVIETRVEKGKIKSTIDGTENNEI